MAGITPQRQFKGTCRLVLHQLHRVGESFDLEECFEAAIAKRMLKEDDVRYIRECFALDEAGEPEMGPDDMSLPDTIKRLQYYVASRMNLGDCA